MLPTLLLKCNSLCIHMLLPFCVDQGKIAYSVKRVEPWAAASEVGAGRESDIERRGRTICFRDLSAGYLHRSKNFFRYALQFRGTRFTGQVLRRYRRFCSCKLSFRREPFWLNTLMPIVWQSKVAMLSLTLVCIVLSPIFPSSRM